ncbi:MAG: hypothetical protein KKG60_03845, partial [Nanoarchaeota archaeon]|nr:hypothetical protein [Nanoarchaeota archaeon]
MRELFWKIKEKIVKGAGKGGNYYPEEVSEDYVEIDADTAKKGKERILIRPFIIEDFTDIKLALDALREGMTIALI